MSLQKICEVGNHPFTLEDADVAAYKKMDVPPPTLCQFCRLERRLSHWPFGVWHKRKCDLSGEIIISTYSPNARFPVYKREYWFSDKWTPPEQEIDWNRPFLDQLYELQSKTPHFHQLGKNNTNCDYADDAWECKSAYLSRSIASCEDVCYMYRVLKSKNCVDLTYCYGVEQCYECTYCFDSFNLKFSLNSRNCSDSCFLYDCRNTTNSFMCWNLRNKQFYIFNKPYSKEEYFSKIKGFKLGSRKSLEAFKQNFQEYIKKDAIHKCDLNINIQNCTGNYILNSKNCRDSYFMENGEDCAYVMRSPSIKNCMDTSGLYRGELCYEICQSTDLNNVQFGHYSVDCHDSQYIDQCFNSHDLLGCVGLKHRQYCVLNKQYSSEEYKKMRERVIEHIKKTGEYGEFFPYRFAYNGFNLSLGSFYFQETEESINIKGGIFETLPDSNAREGIDSNELPDTWEEIKDDIINKPIICAKTKRIFNFIKQEIDFYRYHHLPLPIYYPEVRNLVRFQQLMPLKSRQTKCYACKKETTTYYPKSWDYQKIACEKCYLETVY